MAIAVMVDQPELLVKDTLCRAESDRLGTINIKQRPMSLEGNLLKAQWLELHTKNDLEVLDQVVYCNGLENYALH